MKTSKILFTNICLLRRLLILLFSKCLIFLNAVMKIIIIIIIAKHYSTLRVKTFFRLYERF